MVKESSCSHMEILNTILKRNLKQKIEVDFPKINCLKLKNNRLLTYLDNIEKDTVIEELFISRKK